MLSARQQPKNQQILFTQHQGIELSIIGFLLKKLELFKK